MARLAFFTEVLPHAGAQNEITDFSYGLMISLADQQHDVRVFSTYREGDQLPPSHPRLQVLRPFRKWSWLEIPRLVPILLDFQPEILHFIQPRHEAFSGLTNATSMIPQLSPMIGRPRIVVSLYDVRVSQLKRNRLLLGVADSVIVANREQADEVAKWFGDQPRRPSIEIVALPAVDTLGNGETDEIEVLPAVDRLSEIAKKLVLVPGDADEQNAQELAEVLSRIPDAGVVFAGGWGTLNAHERRAFMREFEDRGVGPRIVLTGPLSPSGELTCLKACAVVYLAGLPTSSLAIARWIRLSLSASRPLVMSAEQQRLDPLRWQERVNVLSRLSDALIDDGLRDEICRRLPDFARTEAIDEPGNAMSRIYAQVLRTPRKPIR